MLNELFSQFDALTEKHRVHKVDTIGDAYLVCAGHESHTVDSTLRVAEFAMDLLKIVRSIKPPNGIDLQMRVGIHTGPAYAGVVGKRIPKYTFFGDTINTASRMENTSWPGCINMSSSARQALASEITDREGVSLDHWLSSLDAKIINRDPIQIKGKGMMELSILCPNKYSPPRNIIRSSDASLLSHISNPMGTNEERLSGETIALKNEIRILRQTLKKVLHEVEVLRSGTDDQLYLPRRGLSAPYASLMPSELTVPTTESLLSQMSDLKCQLLVTTKALTRARQDLIAKDDEMNMIDLQLHKARAQNYSVATIHKRVVKAERRNSSISTSKSSFRAITEELLDNDVPSSDIFADRRQSLDAISSLGELAVDLDVIGMEFSSDLNSNSEK